MSLVIRGRVSSQDRKTDLLHKPFAIYNEHGPQTYALLLNKNTVVSTHPVARITQERQFNLSNATVLLGNILPIPQGMFSVRRNKDNAAVLTKELLVAALESEHLS